MSGKAETVNSAFALYKPLAIAERDLKADPKAWLETERLLAALKENAREPIPDLVLAHIRDRLDGSAKKRQGRTRPPAESDYRKMLIIASFERRKFWLELRKARGGLAGWPLIRNAEWWKGPPSERAARMVVRRFRLNLSWERVRNIASEAAKAAAEA